MAVDEHAVREALRNVAYPGFTKDIVALGVVRAVQIDGSRVRLDLVLEPQAAAVGPLIQRDARATLEALDGVDELDVRLSGPEGGSPALKMAPPRRSVPTAGALDPDLIPAVRHAVAVASGKGGVGKSTIAVNLAVALAASGARVGLLDADIYGPSIPLMTGIDEPPKLTAERKILPFERYGLRIMSLGFLVDRDSAVIWRGPLAMKALDDLLRNVVWGELDYLLIDMPPGTGDTQLTLSQKIRLAGAVIITTPQDVALADARKGVAMFNKVNVPVLGIVENMSYFECPHCSERTEIFGHDGGRNEAKRLGVPFLGQVPLDTAIRTGGDIGRPVVDGEPESARARTLTELAARLREVLETDAATDEADPSRGLFERFGRVVRRAP